jgi:1-deoxy-D-xylulose-5-phosphate reductoisomerase
METNTEKLVPETAPSCDPVQKKRVVVLGSTGSIGQSTLDVIRQFPERFELLALAAGSNARALNSQIAEFQPRWAALASSSSASALEGGSTTEISYGSDAVAALAALSEADIVVAGVVGMAGLPGVLAALKAGKTVALANKESLVAGGPFVREALKGGGRIIPVDSEHSAIFQALGREQYEDIDSLILTASGGPFRMTPKDEFPGITPERAVNHPRWSMGKKISVDSATLMNKALEVIEAHWLYGLPESKIRVLVHPQSIVHSMVEFVDGTVLAQLSVPDMKGAIAYALSFGGRRLPGVMKPTDFVELRSLDFEEVDDEKFPSLALARQAIACGGTAAFVLNVANEEAVASFLQGKIRFDQIFRVCADALEQSLPDYPSEVEELYRLEGEIRRKVQERFSSI